MVIGLESHPVRQSAGRSVGLPSWESSWVGGVSGVRRVDVAPAHRRGVGSVQADWTFGEALVR